MKFFYFNLIKTQVRFIFSGIAPLLAILLQLTGGSAHAQWQETNFPSDKGKITSLALNDGYIFAGGDTSGIFRSDDEGQTWEMTGALKQARNNLTTLQFKGDRLFVVFANSFSDTAVYYSDNYGDNWKATPEKYGYYYQLAANASWLAVGTWYGVHLSDDNGATWTGSVTGLPSNASVTDIAFSGNKMFAAVPTSGAGITGIYFSGNNGSTWSSFNSGMGANKARLLEVSGKKIYAVTESNQVFASSLTSPAWALANNGINAQQIYALTAAGGKIFAGTTNGVFMSADEGASWANISHGLIIGTIITAITADSTHIYIAGVSKVWKRPLSELVGISETQAPDFEVNVVPNPSNGSFRLVLPDQLGCAEFSLMDAGGREVSAGNTCNAVVEFKDQLDAGVYLLTVSHAGKQSMTKVLIE